MGGTVCENVVLFVSSAVKPARKAQRDKHSQATEVGHSLHPLGLLLNVYGWMRYGQTLLHPRDPTECLVQIQGGQ